MWKSFFDYEDGDFLHTLSDGMAMDMDSGNIHIVSSWPSDDEDI